MELHFNRQARQNQLGEDLIAASYRLSGLKERSRARELACDILAAKGAMVRIAEREMHQLIKNLNAPDADITGLLDGIAEQFSLRGQGAIYRRKIMRIRNKQAQVQAQQASLKADRDQAQKLLEQLKDDEQAVRELAQQAAVIDREDLSFKFYQNQATLIEMSMKVRQSQLNFLLGKILLVSQTQAQDELRKTMSHQPNVPRSLKTSRQIAQEYTLVQQQIGNALEEAMAVGEEMTKYAISDSLEQKDSLFYRTLEKTSRIQLRPEKETPIASQIKSKDLLSVEDQQ